MTDFETQKLAERCEWRVPQEGVIDEWVPACSRVSSWPVGQEEERFKFCPLCGKQIERT